MAGPVDMQASKVIESLLAVHEELEALAIVAERDARKGEIYETLERLTNLLVLADSLKDRNLSPDLSKRVTRALHRVRDKMREIGVGAALRVINRCGREASQAVSTHHLVPGRGAKLREKLQAGLATISLLAGAPPDESLAEIETAIAYVNALNTFEAENLSLRPLGLDQPRPDPVTIPWRRAG